MVSKSQKKLLRSLKIKKYRKEHGLFVAEGLKVIREFLEADLLLENLYVLEAEKASFSSVPDAKLVFVSAAELAQLTFLTTPQKAIAVFKIPTEFNNQSATGLQILLDDVSDPGNLGTIIRLCDWFGVETLVCSLTTVDCYNPKVVQATMGSLTRVRIIYTDLPEYINQVDLPVLGTFMEGESVYKTSLPQNALLVLGNEANGISETIEYLVSQKITIPRFGDVQKTESLNVATATAILLSEFRRKS